MIKAIKARWQAYWDGSTVPLFGSEDTHDPALAAPVRSKVGEQDPYAQLSASGGYRREVIPRVRVYELTDPHETQPAPSLATPAQREYEATLPEWAREALAEMDQVVWGVINEVQDEVRTPQYVRRHRRNLMEVLRDDSTDGDVNTLFAALETGADDVPAVVERILGRAQRASSDDVTGLIPVVSDDTMIMEEAAS